MRRDPSNGLLLVAHPALLDDRLSGPAIHIAGTRAGLRTLRYRVATARSPFLERLASGGTFLSSVTLGRLLAGLLTPWVLAGICIRSLSLPYVRHYHTISALYRMLSFARRPFVVEVNATLREEPHALGRLPRPLLGLAERAEMAALKRATVVIAVSGVLRDRLIERGLEAHRVAAVHNGCECPTSDEPAEHLPGTVVYLGSFRPWHRVRLLIEAFAEITPGVAARLVLAGPGDREGLPSAAARLGVSDSVSFPGRQSRAEVAQLMRSAAVLVLPNTADYGSPLKLFEYLASGRPCVLPDLPNIREVIGDSGGAFLFEPGNRAALSSATEAALTSASAAEVGRRGRELVCSGYTWTKNAERIAAALAANEATALEPGRVRGAAPLRVLMAGPHPPPVGGATVAFASLSESLDRLRDVAVRTVDTSHIRGRGLRAPGALLRLLRCAIREAGDADVVTLHASVTALHIAVPAFAWVSGRARVPLIVRMFGGTGLDALEEKRRRAVVRALRSADLFLVETRALADAATAAGLESVRQFPNSRPMPALDGTGVADGPCKRFVFVGHVRSEKGVLELIAAGEELRRDEVVDVFGTLGHDIDLLAFAGLSRVRYMGELEPSDVHETLSRYDCLVLPSYREGYPGVILEAYAAGLPVISTSVGGVPEIVDESTGILLEPGDRAALRNAMSRLASDAGLCTRLREGVRERRADFSEEVWSERFAAYCRELDASAREAAVAADASGRASIGRYWRTVRCLKPRQLWTRVTRRAVKPRVSARPAPGTRVPSRTLVPPVPRPDGWLSPDRVRLLNVERTFESGIDWRPDDASRLWTYHLNYFDDLPQSAGSSESVWMSGLVESWIDANPVGTRDTWDPYPTSLRVVNWIKWLLLWANDGGTAPPSATLGRVLDSLALQVRYLEKSLEYDIMANHLFANAGALVSAGFFFDGREGDRWLRKGLRLVERQLREQVHEDGGHFERSPMYHAIVLEQVLDAINMWDTFPAAVPDGGEQLRDVLVDAARRMLDAHAVMTHPDGDIAFFNDSTLGVAATHSELRAYAEKLGVAPSGEEPELEHWLAHTDYFRMTSEDLRTVVLFDAGGVRPSYQPGHAHCESLSFELSRDGRRVFVNSGISTYEPGPERLRQRQTAAHSTVRIDRAEQSEVWGSHRCGRRAELSHAGHMDGRPVAAHDGYGFLPGGPSQERGVRLDDRRVVIDDTFYGAGEHLLEWYLHLSPDVTGTVRGQTVEVSRDGAPVGTVVFPEGVDVFAERSSYHPGFNLAVPNTRIRAAWRGELRAGFRITIEWA